MTKPTAPTQEQIDTVLAHLAQEKAREDAERQAKADAESSAIKELVASEGFKETFAAMEAVFVGVAPKNVELGYAVNMMERLREKFAA